MKKRIYYSCASNNLVYFVKNKILKCRHKADNDYQAIDSHYSFDEFKDELKKGIFQKIQTKIVKYKKIKLKVIKRTDDFHCSINRKPEIWDCGKTPREALWNWVVTHGKDYGINLITDIKTFGSL